MSANAKERPLANDPNWKAAYQKTRRSLIERLDNWEDQKTWDEFYKTYWRLIYSVATRAGLRSEEAFDAVQETILSIAKQSKHKKYDPDAGSFKSWLMNMTRWRIAEQCRKRAKDTAAPDAQALLRRRGLELQTLAVDPQRRARGGQNWGRRAEVPAEGPQSCPQ